MIATRIGLLGLAAGLLGCGGSIKGPDGSTTGACASLGACECMAASDRCAARTESCYCPTACDPQIVCICGGGRFLACEEKATFASCRTQLAAVQAKCAGQAFAHDIGDICSTGADPTCVAGCLASLNTGGSCSEIDCRFCRACDCDLPATPSPFADCLATCAPPLPER
jgi:hypothetical protein